MKTRVETSCCSKATFASEEEARRYWRRMEDLGLSRVLPTDVEQCMRGWHLTFPPKQAKPRKPLKRSKSKKHAKPQPVPEAAKELIRARSGGLCEVGLLCGGQARGVDPAHREGKGSGGTDKWWSDLASNLLWSCREDHDFIDNKQPAKAERLGMKARAGVARPWEIPVKHKRLGWVLLDHNGGHRPAPTFSTPEGRRPIPVVACTVWELIASAGAIAEALERHGHKGCPLLTGVRDGLLVCGCGRAVFAVEEVAA